MNILITGAAGFIGSHLANHHLQKGDSVWGVDSLISAGKKNIEPLFSHPHFTFTHVDMNYWPELQKALTWADRVYHMAALLGMKLVFSRPFDVISENIHSTERLLKTAKDISKPLHILIASSSCVYGSAKSSVGDLESAAMTIFSETYLQETYAASKIVGEVMALCCNCVDHLHISIARFFNLIGSNQTGRYGMVVPTFVKQALANEPITVFGTGLQTRSFCSVKDAIDASERVLSEKACRGKVYNIGSPHEISILHLAEKIKQKTSSTSEIIFIPYIKAYGIDYKEIERRCPNIDRLQNDTGFSIKYSLDDTLDEIIEAKRKELFS